ncbi:MAG: hypothetical protein AB1736_02820 [Chloroflexota bacterium]
MATLDRDHDSPTRATYRALLVRGFTPGEAANLTAYLAGIEVGAGRPWRLADIDRLLFLRELCRTGRLGADDGLATGPMTAGLAPA